jgi:hypothetical protein
MVFTWMQTQKQVYFSSTNNYMEKKDNEVENAPVKDEKNEEVSVDSTSIKDGKPQQLETKEKNQ